MIETITPINTLRLRISPSLWVFPANEDSYKARFHIKTRRPRWSVCFARPCGSL